MKNTFRIIIISTVFVIMAILLLLSVISEKPFKTELGYTGKPVSFQKTETSVFSRVSVNSEGEIQQVPISIDMYFDEDENTYLYFSGTDVLCGYNKKNCYGVYTENSISQEEAVKIADEHLSEYIEEFSEYSLNSVRHSSVDAVYYVQYSYMVDGIATDCNITVYVQEIGEIGAFFMYKRQLVDFAKNVIVTEEIKNKNTELYISIGESSATLVEYYQAVDEKGNVHTETKVEPIEIKDISKK